MRLWSLHPGHLDTKGLVALWREALLAQAVLNGQTSGYKAHPQLIRFRATESPSATIAFYLKVVYTESVNRGFKFDQSKIVERGVIEKIGVNQGQIYFEWNHLLAKLKTRSPAIYGQLIELQPNLHPLFVPRIGDIETWERT